jgi:integrase
MPGSGYSPLQIEAEPGEKSELEKFREAAHSSPPHDELIALVGVDTGLRAEEIGHLVEDWLDRSGGSLTIDVPQVQRCRLGTKNAGRGGDTTERTQPCYYCRHRNMDKDWVRASHKLPDNGDCWRPKTEAGHKGREIPILEDDTKRVITNYFKVHDRVCARQAVRDAVVRVAERAGIHKTWTEVKDNGDEITHHWPTTHDLRDTFGTRLALKDFTAHEIKSVMGHESIEQGDDYIELSGAATTKAMKEKW